MARTRQSSNLLSRCHPPERDRRSEVPGQKPRMHRSSYCRIPLHYEFPAFARSDDNNFPLYPSWVLSSQLLRDGDRSLAFLKPRTSLLENLLVSNSFHSERFSWYGMVTRPAVALLALGGWNTPGTLLAGRCQLSLLE
jgi:hypothetical protein